MGLRGGLDRQQRGGGMADLAAGSLQPRQTESACAGALGVQLAGPAYYFGEYYDKPTIGDPLRPVEPQDILRADRMMYAESTLALALGLAVRALLVFGL